jgi:hypothetical protein
MFNKTAVMKCVLFTVMGALIVSYGVMFNYGYIALQQ